MDVRTLTNPTNGRQWQASCRDAPEETHRLTCTASHRGILLRGDVPDMVHAAVISQTQSKW